MEKLMKGDPMPFYSQMRKRCINAKEFSDIQFLIGPRREPVFAHRAVLAARSEVFRTVLRQKGASVDKNQPLILEDEKTEVFLTMLDFMYTNCCTLTYELAPHVLAAANEYGLDGLRRITSKFMADNITTETACAIIDSAVLNQQKELVKRVLTFIEEHTEDCFASQSFLEISDATVSFLLRSDLLRIDELEILNSIKKWAETVSYSENRPMEEVAAPVIGSVRLALIGSDELSQIEGDNDVVPFIPVEMLANAWKLHALKHQKYKENSELRLRRGTIPRDHHQFIAKSANLTGKGADEDNSEESSSENQTLSDEKKVDFVLDDENDEPKEKTKKLKKKKKKSKDYSKDSS